MSEQTTAALIFAAGLGQASILVASALVPSTLRWRDELRPLPTLHRQMHWVYAGYVVLSIVAFATISLRHAAELAAGGGLARAVCGYMAIFWGVRLVLQAVFDTRPIALLDGFVVIGAGLALLVIVEFEKWARLTFARRLRPAGT